MTVIAAPMNPASADAGIFFDPEPTFQPDHLLGLEGMPRPALLDLLDQAERYRTRLVSGTLASDQLQGVAICNAFFEDSTRTRVSFELAAKRLGAISVTISSQGCSLSKGESLLDTVRTIVAMHVSAVVIRHRSAGVPAFLAKHVDASIINAGDGAHEHPTQGLLDLMTLRRAWGDRFEGRRIAIVGDIAHSRVARSAIFGLHTLGASITVAGPETLVPRGIEELGCALAPTVEEAMEFADAVMTLRLQTERMQAGLIPSIPEYARLWGVNARRVALMKPDAVVLHPGPVHRGVELSPDVADGGRSVILDQVENGVAVRCAVLARYARRGTRLAA